MIYAKFAKSFISKLLLLYGSKSNDVSFHSSFSKNMVYNKSIFSLRSSRILCVLCGFFLILYSNYELNFPLLSNLYTICFFTGFGPNSFTTATISFIIRTRSGAIAAEMFTIRKRSLSIPHSSNKARIEFTLFFA
jgi:hypothetical protein